MSEPNFEVKVDQHGRHVSQLRPGPSTEIAVSGTAAGGSLQGDVIDLESKIVVVRLSSNVDVYVAFSDNASQDDATSADQLFLAGTETFTMPDGTSYVSVVAADGSSTGKFSAQILT